MIIARTSKNEKGVEILILGLSDANLQAILGGRPLHVRKEAHGNGCPDGMEIVIFHGTTEMDMKAMFDKHGWLTPQTDIRIDPRLKS